MTCSFGAPFPSRCFTRAYSAYSSVFRSDLASRFRIEKHSENEPSAFLFYERTVQGSGINYRLELSFEFLRFFARLRWAKKQQIDETSRQCLIHTWAYRSACGLHRWILSSLQNITIYSAKFSLSVSVRHAMSWPWSSMFRLQRLYVCWFCASSECLRDLSEKKLTKHPLRPCVPCQMPFARQGTGQNRRRDVQDTNSQVVCD